MKVTLEGIQAKIKGETYLVLPDGRTTLCVLTLENGYTIKGLSACVDAAEFNLDLGRKYAFEDALRQIWPLEGYLLAENLFQEERKKLLELGFKPTAQLIGELAAPQVEAMKRAGVWQVKEKRDQMIATMVKASKKPHWTQTPEGKKKLAARKRKGTRK